MPETPRSEQLTGSNRTVVLVYSASQCVRVVKLAWIDNKAYIPLGHNSVLD